MRKLFVFLILGIFLIGIHVVSEIRNSDAKSDIQEEVWEVMEKYPNDEEAEDICFEKACESFNLKWGMGAVPKDLEIKCVNDLGFVLMVGIANTEVKECDKVVGIWIQQEWEFARMGI